MSPYSVARKPPTILTWHERKEIIRRLCIYYEHKPNKLAEEYNVSARYIWRIWDGYRRKLDAASPSRGTPAKGNPQPQPERR